jgi:glycerol-3-phosphate acyltransferase PlsX
MKVMQRIENPSVGLLNIGEEEGKGNDLVVEAHRMFKESSLNFCGNIEGRDILSGKADVVVCDGFVGNIILKHSEAMLEVFKKKLREKMRFNPFGWLGALLLLPVMKKLKKEFDYEEYGGVPLLGANGVVIICHGSSTPRAIMRAISVADRMSSERVNQQIEEQIAVKDAAKTH